MSTLSLRMPNSLHEMAKKLAKKDNSSINQWVITAVAEKISALSTEEYLAKRAKKGSRKKFLEALSKVPNTAPSSEDEI